MSETFRFDVAITVEDDRAFWNWELARSPELAAHRAVQAGARTPVMARVFAQLCARLQLLPPGLAVDTVAFIGSAPATETTEESDE